MSKSFNAGRSQALNSGFFRVQDALDNMPEWRRVGLDEAEFRRGWADISQSFSDVLVNVKRTVKSTLIGCDFGD